MAKYTELFSEYLSNGHDLPSVFNDIDGFSDLFVLEYCDKEIGFETEELFAIKLNARANIIIPSYVDKLLRVKNSLLKVETPTKTRQRIFDGGQRDAVVTEYPINSINVKPTQKTVNNAYTDTDTNTETGFTVDEAIKRAEFLKDLSNYERTIIDECLKEFSNLFLKVY